MISKRKAQTVKNGTKIIEIRKLNIVETRIVVDGEGTVMTCAETLLREESGRNVPNMTKEEIEKTLCDYLGCSKVLWVPEGIYNDETNGHIDNICNFVKPGEVVLAWTDDESDPQYAISKKALEYNKLAESQAFAKQTLAGLWESRNN